MVMVLYGPVGKKSNTGFVQRYYDAFSVGPLGRTCGVGGVTVSKAGSSFIDSVSSRKASFRGHQSLTGICDPLDMVPNLMVVTYLKLCLLKLKVKHVYLSKVRNVLPC